MDPKIQEHSLTPQGRIYKTAVATDEGLQDIGPEFRGTGATPQQKGDDSKSWISHDQPSNAAVDDANGSKFHDHGSAPQPDVYAQALAERMPAPVNAAMAKLGDSVEGVVGRTNSRDTKSSETFSQHLHGAAVDKMNTLKSSFTANFPSKQAAADTPATIAAKAYAEETPRPADDVVAVLLDGGHTPENPLEANMRATTEMLS